LPKYTNYEILLGMWRYITDNHLLEGTGSVGNV
jgi:hypothetical protein